MSTGKPHPDFPAKIDNSDIDAGKFEENICIIFCSIVPLFMVARFYSRIIAKQLGVDDWASLAAFVRILILCRRSHRRRQETNCTVGICDDL